VGVAVAKSGTTVDIAFGVAVLTGDAVGSGLVGVFVAVATTTEVAVAAGVRFAVLVAVAVLVATPVGV
jgi:hypothetical protein